MKKYALVFFAALMLGSAGTWVATVQSVQAQSEFHPRIATAIRQLEDAIAYLELAPHDFGGHKDAAIRDSRAAIVQLRLALAFREGPRR